jgi:transposase-like protein
MWVGASTGESAKFWMSVLSELRNRGVRDVCILCCDGLSVLPEAAITVWPQTAALEVFAQARQQRYPAIVRLWRAHWAEFTPFLGFPPQVRRVIYTTNLIESLNARLRKVTRNRGRFPSEQAALTVLHLAVRSLEDYRRPTVGIRSSGWKQALQAFTIYFEGRIPAP